MENGMNLTLKVWRQANAEAQGQMTEYKLGNVSPDMSFLEMMDVLNDELIRKGEDPVTFDHDCREGICFYCICCNSYISQYYGFCIFYTTKILTTHRHYQINLSLFAV